MDMVQVQLGLWEKDGDDVKDYMSWISKEGYAWVRYSGPRGTEDAQELAFELRIGGSRFDHPKHIIRFTQLLWDQLEEKLSAYHLASLVDCSQLLAVVQGLS